MNEYDILIIGSGPAGHTAAFEAAKRKMSAAIIERDPARLGGVCLGEGCIPLKGLLYHSHANTDYFALRNLVMSRVSQIRAGLLSRLKGLGIDIIAGEGRFVSPREVEAGGARLSARHILIATGSKPRRLFDRPCVHTSEKIFDLDAVPKRALVIGGGVVGCEYASFLAAIGASVDIVEVLGSLLAGEDEEAVRVMTRDFKKRGINPLTTARVSDIDPSGEAVLQKSGADEKRAYDIIFETAGRIPSTEGLDCAAAGVTLTDGGFIAVDEAYRTPAGNIYAAGDCIDTPMLAYAAAREAEAAVHHIATGNVLPVDYTSMPRLVFSTPQVGSVGTLERSAKERGIECRVFRHHFRALGKAVMEGRETGFVKLVVNAATGAIIGASAAGDDIADIMNLLTLIVRRGLTVGDVASCMFVHPSFSEIILDALRYGG